jgi:hypothetical protein
MSKYRIEISEEARQAFESELEIQGLSESAKVSIITTCLPLFAMGYASAQKAAERGAKQCLERLEAREKLAQDLGYPGAWDTAAYPNVESAAIEALHAANVEAKEFAKRLAKEPKDAHYTMDQMRDYAAGVFTTRLYSVVHALEEKIRESVITAATLQADSSRALNDSPGAYRMIAAELRTIADNAKALGSKPFQKRAQYWAKKCFGLTLATDRNERNQRFAEEAIELVQACGMSERAVLGAVAYVYNRPVGEVRQEVGGTYTTLALLCAANGIDMVAEGEKDLLEIDNDETSARIREKRRTKPDFAGYELREN